jgi:hypothetical protein
VQPPRKGYRVKYTKANTLRTQQFIAWYGKSARFPVCQAWLSLRGLRADLSERMKDEVSVEKDLNRAKELKEEAEGAIKQLRKERKEKEANLWAARKPVDAISSRPKDQSDTSGGILRVNSRKR